MRKPVSMKARGPTVESAAKRQCWEHWLWQLWGLFGLCVGHVAYAKPIALNELAQPSVTSDLGAAGIKQDVGTFGDDILEDDWPVLKKD